MGCLVCRVSRLPRHQDRHHHVPPANIYDQEVKKVIRKAVRAEQGRQETPGIFLGAVLPGRHGQADHEDELHFSLLLEAAVAEAAETRIMEVAAPTEIN